MNETLQRIAIDELTPDPSQPRKTFIREEIERLAASIAARGVLLPLRVLRDEERRCWRIVTGESRWRAARIAGLTHVPCIPVEGKPSEEDLLSDQVVENAVRHALRPLELARSLAKLEALKGCNAKTLAEELGLSGAAISRAKALLTLPEAIQAMVDDGRMPESVGYEISRLPDEHAQHELAGSVAAGRLNRDQVAEAVRDRIGKKNVRPRASRLSWKPRSGPSITVSAQDALSLDDLIESLSQLQRHAKRALEKGMDVVGFARTLRA
jgi:ParB family chromosome partitioning protein